MFLFINYISTLKSSFYLNFSNYLTLNVPVLGLYINFLSKVLCIHYYNLLKNLRYPFSVYYTAILLLNFV